MKQIFSYITSYWHSNPVLKLRLGYNNKSINMSRLIDCCAEMDGYKHALQITLICLDGIFSTVFAVTLILRLQSQIHFICIGKKIIFLDFQGAFEAFDVTESLGLSVISYFSMTEIL